MLLTVCGLVSSGKTDIIMGRVAPGFARIYSTILRVAEFEWIMILSALGSQKKKKATVQRKLSLATCLVVALRVGVSPTHSCLGIAYAIFSIRCNEFYANEK